MAHPIFDRSTYAWKRPEAVALHEALAASIPQWVEIGQLYAQAGGDPGLLNTPQAPKPLWSQALELLAQARALRQLCEVVLPGVARLQNAQEFQAAVRAVIDSTPDVDRRIIAGVPVLDRHRLRTLVTTLQSDASLRVLLVRGDPKTGKTHGRHLFQAAAADSGAAAVYLYAPMIATIDDVVENLFGALNALDEIPPRDTTEEAWYRTVCTRLGALAATKDQQLWIAVDDLGADTGPEGAPLLDPSITAFCGQFALNMANPAFGRWFRLMLIHYPPDPVPTRWLREVWEEDRLSLTDVQKEDVQEFLRDWAASVEGKFLEDELAALAADVMAKVDAPATNEETNKPRLQRLHDRLMETLLEQAQVLP